MDGLIFHSTHRTSISQILAPSFQQVVPSSATLSCFLIWREIIFKAIIIRQYLKLYWPLFHSKSLAQLFLLKMKRYQIAPITLFRMQSELKPTLRQKIAQERLDRMSFDYLADDKGLYNPILGDKFKIPNGLSLRPMGIALRQIASNFYGKIIYEIPKGTQVPSGMVLIHERSDHFSLQTAKPIKPELFCEQAHEFLKKCRLVPYEQFKKQLMKVSN